MGKDGKSMFLLNSVRSFKLNISKIAYALQDIICDRLTRVFDPCLKKNFFFKHTAALMNH